MKLLCDGPGPHNPKSGIIGEADQQVSGMRCDSAACATPTENEPDQGSNVTADPAALEAATAKVQAATTVAGLRTALLQALSALSTD